MKKELTKFWWNNNVIILEWKQEASPYLLTNDNKLISLENNVGWQLTKNERKNNSLLITFIYRDKSFGSLRFVGDGYYHPAKQMHVAILWPVGHAKNALERSL